MDASGNLFIADTYNNVIRKVDTNGYITAVAGNYYVDPVLGEGGYSGDGDYATKACVNNPSGVRGCLWEPVIADTGNNVIRKVGTNGIISTLAGNGYGAGTGYGGYSGERDYATNAMLYGPSGVAVDAFGNLFIADTYNNVIRKVDTNGIITTVAGRGLSNVNLFNPSGVAVDTFGNLFIADSGNSVIRKLDRNGIITTVAGNGIMDYSGNCGPSTSASLSNPFGIAVDAFGNLFIADTGNNVIRKVDPNGTITTMDLNYYGEGTNALLKPSGEAVDAFGNLFIADTYNNLIRKVVMVSFNPTLTLCNVATNNAGNYTVIITVPAAA